MEPLAELPTRTADTDVIDERAPRTNQSVVFLDGARGGDLRLAAGLGADGPQLLIGLLFGRRFCLPCLAYFELIQPRIGEGRLEDSRPPRLANQIGFAFLGAAAASWWLGAETLGTALGAIVAALALLAAVTGFCTGCELYKLSARLRGISARHHDRIEPGDLDGFQAADRNIVQFTHPICSDCREWDRRLEAEGTPGSGSTSASPGARRRSTGSPSCRRSSRSTATAPSSSGSPEVTPTDWMSAP